RHAPGGGQGAARHAHAHRVVVDHAVAVVVDAVAGLRLGADHLHAGEAARPGAGHAGAHVARGACAGGVHAAAAAGQAHAGHVVVLAVAVVVLAVPRLQRRADRARAHHRAVLAQGDARLALPHAVAALLAGAEVGARHPHAGHVVVHQAIAVVVDAVAHLGRRADHLGAGE